MSVTTSVNAATDRDRLIISRITRRLCLMIAKLSITFFAALVVPRLAHAQVLYFWNNPSGGSYGSAVNWFPGAGAPPGPSDGAEFGLAATYTVNFFSDFTVSDAYVVAGNVTWDLGQGVGFEHTYSILAAEVSGAASLTFFDGTVFANTLLISSGGQVVVLGVDRNDAAHITVTGAGSSLMHNNFLAIADYRPETLTIQNGGAVTSGTGFIGSDLFGGSAGTVDVTGAGSAWTTTSNLIVGSSSPGTLNVTGGGAVSTLNASNGSIGADANGTVNITGAGSTWMITNNLSLGFGEGFTGTLNIMAGGAVSNVNARVAANSGSGTVTVSGVGSLWTSSGELTVGFNSGITGSTATLTIDDGGAVTNTNGVIGNVGVFFDFPAAVGTVTVTDTGSTWTNSGDLSVGFEGIGTLNIENGGAVSNSIGNVAYAPDSEGDVTVTGVGSTWSNSGDLTVGRGGISTLSIENGGAVSNNVGYVAYLPGSEGDVIVSGPGSTWTNNGSLQIGRQGDGTLTITDGGEVTSDLGHIGGGSFAEPDTGTGSVTVSGAGSTWTSDNNIHVGFQNTGTMTIQDGGAVSNMNGFVATFVGSTGTATVTGAGSTWTNSDSLNIGNLGNGKLFIENGGAVTNTDGHVGPSPGSLGQVYVRGAGSTWNMTGDLFLGSQGTGTLEIENGGSVFSNSGNLGRAGGAPFGGGAAYVTGAGSTWTNTGDLRVANDGNGVLGILFGGTVSNASAYLATNVGTTGYINVSDAGSRWTISQRLSVAGDVDTATSGGDGQLDINPGGTVSVAQDVVIFNNGLVRLRGGTLDTAAISFQGGGQFEWTSGTLHVGTFNGGLVNPAGVLAPGSSAGSTTILGAYSQGADAALEIEVGGTTPGTTYDTVSVSGLALLGGELQLLMLNGFQPSGANTFSVLSAAGGLFGNFSNASSGQHLATIDDLGSFQVHYGAGSPFNPTQVVLSNFIPNALPADFNDDGVVNAADYVVWRKFDLGQAAYDTWHAYFGQTAGSGSGATANATIPEPPTMVMLIVTAASMSTRRRWHTWRVSKLNNA